MVRNRRADTKIDWKKRNVENYMVTFTNEEIDLYEEVKRLKDTNMHGLSLTTLLRETCSSKQALGVTLSNMLKKRVSYRGTRTAVNYKDATSESERKSRARTKATSRKQRKKRLSSPSTVLLKRICSGFFNRTALSPFLLEEALNEAKKRLDAPTIP